MQSKTSSTAGHQGLQTVAWSGLEGLGGHNFRIQREHAAGPDPEAVCHTNIINKNNF